MTLLFGQLPQGAYVDRQFTLHVLVGSVGDVVPETPKPPAILGGGGKHSPTYIKRDRITPTPPTADDDLIAALAVLTLLQTDQDI